MYYCCEKHHTEECPAMYGVACHKRELDDVNVAIEARVAAENAWRDYPKEKEFKGNNE